MLRLSNLHLIDWESIVFDSSVSRKDVRRGTSLAEALHDLKTARAVFMFEESGTASLSNNNTVIRNFVNNPLAIKKYIA
jgi:hypothetical protein